MEVVMQPGSCLVPAAHHVFFFDSAIKQTLVACARDQLTCHSWAAERSISIWPLTHIQNHRSHGLRHARPLHTTTRLPMLGLETSASLILAVCHARPPPPALSPFLPTRLHTALPCPTTHLLAPLRAGKTPLRHAHGAVGCAPARHAPAAHLHTVRTHTAACSGICLQRTRT